MSHGAPGPAVLAAAAVTQRVLRRLLSLANDSHLGDTLFHGHPLRRPLCGDYSVPLRTPSLSCDSSQHRLSLRLPARGFGVSEEPQPSHTLLMNFQSSSICLFRTGRRGAEGAAWNLRVNLGRTSGL